MKIAVTTSGDTLDAPLDPRFGRAAKFLIHDTDTGEFEVIDNTQNMQAAQGAGVQSAQTVARSGAEAVATGHCGPKAFRVLQGAGLTVYNLDVATVREAIDLITSGQAEAAGDADVEAHWT